MLRYSLASNRDVRRGLGSYANALYSIIKHSGYTLSEELWCARIGADKFFEAVELGILEAEEIGGEEDIEREGQVIKENPPKPVESKTYKINKFVAYSANNAGPVWEQAVVIELEINGQNGHIRLYQSGKGQVAHKEEWTTDNLDLANHVCDNLEQLKEEMLNQVGDKTLFGEDTGPFQYDVLSRCPGTDETN